MRKIKLLLSFLALFMGGNYVNAQASYNHIYQEGVTVAEGTDYFLYNIGAGMFLTDGMDWGTHATADHAGRKITFAALADGKYSIYTESYSLNNNQEAKKGYMTTNGYLDTGTNDANWTFTPVSVAGYTNAYTIKNSDTQYLIFDKADSRVQVTNSTNDNYSYWLVIPKTARDAVGDLTYYLMNTDMNRPWERKVWNGLDNNNQIGGNAANRCAERYHATVDINQTISASVPEGRYKVYAQGFWRQDGSAAGPVLYANSDTQLFAPLTGTENSMTDASNSFTAGKYVNSVETFVNDGKLKVGINITAADQWVIFDNFVLDYIGQVVKDYAVALPDGGAMAADKWYYFDIAAAADNYTATATTLGDIICTADGYTLTSASSGDITLTAEDNDLAATRYYVKSSSANNLEIAVAAYTYSISEATADVTYVQAGNTVTVNYTTSTNDPDGSLTQDYSGVTFGGEAIAVTPTASGFTFTVPAVTAATDYTLSIPAGAIKYNNDNQNAAQNITLKTPTLFDGTYFMKVAATYDGSSEGTSSAVGKYLGRGCAYGTHLSLDAYGIPVSVTTNGSNVSILKIADTNAYVFSSANYDAYADGGVSAATGFTFSILNGKYLIASNNRSTPEETKYLKYNTSALSDEEIAVYDDGIGTNNGPIIMWAVETVSEHATAMQTKKDNQAAAAAAAAYASGNYATLNGITTVSALESELTTNYIEGAFVSPSALTSVSESYQPRNNTAGNVNAVSVYSNTINITEAGFYKFSMQAFVRTSTNDNTQAAHTAGYDFPAAILYFGDSETQIKSIYDETGYAEATTHDGRADVAYNGVYYPDGTDGALVFFQDDKYHNDVWFYCSTPGTYTYGVKVLGYAGSQWFIYSPQSVSVTSYAAAATTTDYTALSNAIDAYDAATWGFESGEYAPYNNVAAINNIAAARAIDSEVVNSKLLVNSLTTNLALSAANVSEVNAFFGGDFTQYETISGEDIPYGWNLYNGASNHSRIMGGTEGSNNAGLAATSSGKALLLKFNATYGESEGYTMPLKAGKLYKITFKHGRWSEAKPRITDVIMTDPDGASIALAPGFQATDNDCQAENGPWYTYTGYFVSTTAGNYKFNLTKQGGNSQMQIAIADIELKSSTDALVFTDGAVPTYAPGTYPAVKIDRSLTADKWVTAVYPFAVSGVDKIAVLDNYAASTGQLSFVSASSSTANEPFLMRSETGLSEISLNNVNVEAIDNDPSANASELHFIGSYAETEITKDQKNYVLKDNTIYPVGENPATINPYRAYFQVDQDGQEGEARALTLFIDGEVTGISELVKMNNEQQGQVYDLQGRKVEKTAKGLYIKNGKKVVVK